MKALIALAILAISISSFAQSRGGSRSDSRIDLGGGRTTVRIDLGTRTDMDQNARIRMLEEAVRDLQYQVYDLRDQPQTTVVRTNVCSLKTSFDGTFIGKAATRVEAEADARNKCERARAGFCGSTKVNCEIVEEVVSIR
jgi:hypothetical protein